MELDLALSISIDVTSKSENIRGLIDRIKAVKSIEDVKLIEPYLKA